MLKWKVKTCVNDYLCHLITRPQFLTPVKTVNHSRQFPTLCWTILARHSGNFSCTGPVPQLKPGNSYIYSLVQTKRNMRVEIVFIKVGSSARAAITKCAMFTNNTYTSRPSRLTQRKPRSSLIFNGEQGFLWVNRLYVGTAANSWAPFQYHLYFLGTSLLFHLSLLL